MYKGLQHKALKINNSSENPDGSNINQSRTVLQSRLIQLLFAWKKGVHTIGQKKNAITAVNLP